MFINNSFLNKNMRYEHAPELKQELVEIAKNLEMDHIDLDRVGCIKSHGSKARRVIARCYSLPKVIQKAMLAKPFYVIELISERFDKLDEEEKTKTLIHELLHIPKSFAGGFKHHNVVNRRLVEKLYKTLKNNIGSKC